MDQTLLALELANSPLLSKTAACIYCGRISEDTLEREVRLGHIKPLIEEAFLRSDLDRLIDLWVKNRDDEPPVNAGGSTDGYVYFIVQVNVPESHVKIGFTTNIQRRMNGLHAASPTPLSIVAAIPGTRHTEQLLHIRFKNSRRHGEWFEQTPDIREYILGILESRNA